MALTHTPRQQASHTRTHAAPHTHHTAQTFLVASHHLSALTSLLVTAPSPLCQCKGTMGEHLRSVFELRTSFLAFWFSWYSSARGRSIFFYLFIIILRRQRLFVVVVVV